MAKNIVLVLEYRGGYRVCEAKGSIEDFKNLTEEQFFDESTPGLFLKLNTRWYLKNMNTRVEITHSPTPGRYNRFIARPSKEDGKERCFNEIIKYLAAKTEGKEKYIRKEGSLEWVVLDNNV